MRLTAAEYNTQNYAVSLPKRAVVDTRAVKSDAPDEGGPDVLHARHHQDGKVVIIESRCLIRGWVVSSVRAALGEAIEDFTTAQEWLERTNLEERVALLIYCVGDLAADQAARTDLELLLERAGDTPVIVSSDNELPALILELLELGIKGYIPTSLPLNIWIEALRLVRAGGVFAPASCLMTVSQSARAQSDDADFSTPLLTARQVSVVEELRRGKSNKVIAYELNMCESTVKVHVRNIMKKLQAKNRTEVALMANEILKHNNS
jgi:DNA-binding NarL/FixJ family response regulator